MYREADEFHLTNTDTKSVPPKSSRSASPGTEKICLPFQLLSYDTGHAKIGKAFIFSHNTFDDACMRKREGNIKDVDALRTVLDTLGYDIAVYNDLRCDDIKKTLKEAASDVYTDYSSVMMIFMTHGESGILHARDSSYPIDSIWKPFLNGNKSLLGKPKIFLMQACRGKEGDLGNVTRTDDITKEKHWGPKIPVFADFLFAFSTAPGYVAFNEPNSGSWFIQSLCKCIEQVKPNLNQFDLETILTMVKLYVATTYTANCPGSAYDGNKQIPFISSTLRRRFYLTAAPATVDGDGLTRTDSASKYGNVALPPVINVSLNGALASTQPPFIAMVNHIVLLLMLVAVVMGIVVIMRLDDAVNHHVSH